MGLTMLSQAYQAIATLLTPLRGESYFDRMYKGMHEKMAFRGDTWRGHLLKLIDAVPDIRSKKILDFGCGPKGGLAAELGDCVTSYDPYVPAYSHSPWGDHFDVIFSSDVLEHMTSAQIGRFLTNVRMEKPEFVFLCVATRRAQKSLPNGANAHLTVRSPVWWLDTVSRGLGTEYVPKMAVADLLGKDVVMCFATHVAQHQSMTNDKDPRR